MPKPIKKTVEALWNTTLYTISLPERYIRGLTALLGGMLHETTEILIPDFVKDTTTYNLFVTNLLRFAVENVGEVKGVYDVCQSVRILQYGLLYLEVELDFFYFMGLQQN